VSLREVVSFAFFGWMKFRGFQIDRKRVRGARDLCVPGSFGGVRDVFPCDASSRE